VLYYTFGYSGAGCGSAMPDTLYQINPQDGTTMASVQVTISGSGVNEFVGSAFVGGTLYGFTSGGQEYTIDPATGIATLVANTTQANTAVSVIAAGSQ
jgi:glutamine cyclotransferase